MHRLHRILFFLIACVMLQGVASASTAPRFVHVVTGENNRDGSSWVVINGERVMLLKTSNGTLTPDQRGAIVVERLQAFAQKGLDAKAVSCKQVGKEARVMIGDSLLAIATEAEAKAQNLTTVKLAERWAQNIKKALTLPPLATVPTSLLVPLGENRSVAVRSQLSSPVMMEVSDPTIISVDLESKPGSLQVFGLGLGDAVITLRCEGHSAKVAVSVRKYAASVSPGVVEATVTGRNAPKALVSRAAGEMVRTVVTVEPGARLQSVSVPAIDRDLAPGQSAQMNVQIEAGGDQYIPVKLSIPVVVSNQGIPSGPASTIMYSNHPETVRKYQVLFTGRTTASREPTRLLYHHQNRMEQKIGFVIDVVNPSDSPANLHVIEGISPPMLDTVVVGYRAGLDFVENHQKNIGRVITVPGGTRRVLVSQGVDHPHTASGIIDLHQISGDPLLVRVLTKPESQRVAEDPTGVAIPAGGFDLSKIAMSDHVYPGPLRQIDANFTVGKTWLFLRMGKEHLKHATEDMLLYGNYGVIYDISAKVDNPLDVDSEVEVVFEATAGPASAIFLIDGRLVHIKYAHSTAENILGKFTVPAGRSKTVSIRTVPLSGSAYPATIIVRPARSVSAQR